MMRRLSGLLALAAVLAMILAPIAAIAAPTIPSYEQLTVAGTAVGITAATYGPAPDGTPRTSCLLVLETAQVRWRADGIAPSSTVGTPFDAGGSLTIPASAFKNFQAIRTTGTSGVLNITCE